MNTAAVIHDLLDWIDNNLESRLDIETVARRRAIRNGTCSGSSRSTPVTLSLNIFACISYKDRSNA